ncbi:MAG TPA: S8 family serine peptidase [Miltoncostaeaceae bacterium]|nr:S8 family serine peptidase [Miltoncostaeaceae bacterium]
MTPAAQPPPLPPPAMRAAVPAASADPLARTQGFLAQIRWTPPKASGRRPIVAVLDTGVDATDPDLRDAVLAGRARSFVPGMDPLVDPSGHGTHVAGIVAAATGNRIGGAGVARARILPVTIADASGRATTSALVRGIRYATARGARVVNISFGGEGFSQLEQDAIDAAVRRGVLVVVPVGNSGGRPGPPGYPGAYRHVMTVAALGRDGRVLPLSERGDQVSIAAPGERVFSSSVGRSARLVPRTGTSMAAAVVAGAAARVIAERPGLSAERVRTLLEATARDVPPGGIDSGSGAGALDLEAALAAAPPRAEDREPNDDPPQAARSRALMGGSARSAAVTGRTGSYSDPRDGFRVVLRAGDALRATLAPLERTTADLDLVLWRPGTPAGRRGSSFARRWLVAASLRPGTDESLSAVAPVGGVYTLEVQGLRSAAPYRLTVERSAA